ncbi:hypothetical protein PRZ48_003979 [Zasmidium cellare]|uniref:TOG domain-containing protein n=1 Tax=Zasmidium cellare TaxID=395010 RepID=A0ABR0EWK1_ZASCE|nr:hypothetical protein PRZ48_003979 [Zasmidium cellare]
MDQQAVALLAILKRPAASSEQKVQQFNALKSDIKHYRVPESAQPSVFECIKLAITQQASSTLASTAFSTLGHLLKRLKIQDHGHAITQLAPRLFASLQERLGDLREPVRSAASQALSDLYPFCSSDVEEIIQEAIGGANARAKETAMRWVVRMHKEEGMPFKGYVSSIVARLEDADGNTREAAKSVLIDLFSTAPERAKLDLKRQLKAHSVRHSIVTQILSQIGADGAPTSRPQTAEKPEPSPEMTASTRSLPTVDHAAHFAETLNSEAAQPPPQETVQMDPIYIDTQRELEDTFRDMLPHFEGKETEQNWIPRDKSILKLRRILKGNSPNEFHAAFMAGIKSMVDGMIRVSNSLRTTMASNGCQLVQELARTLGPALDPHVEMFLQSFIKMSAATKHIAAENGRVTSDAIFQNCTYHVRMVQHIWFAVQEKNVQLRQCTPGWLTTILKRQASYKSSFESSGGLELAEKCIKKGLDDANPKVKEGYRATYWTFAKTWPARADAIISKLDPKSKTALERDSHNPNAALHQSVTTTSATSRPGTASRSTLREVMAEQRKAKAAGKLPSRPNSAMADLSPAKARAPAGATNSTTRPSNLSKVTNRNVSTASNASTTEPPGSSTGTKKGSSLMSGPVRRPRRPEIARPQTADPYASRRMLRPETPANGTPAGSPDKGTGASKASQGSLASSVAARSRPKAAGSAIGSPGSPGKRSPVLIRGRGQPAPDSRPTSKGSTTNGDTMMSIREDDLTMVMPKGSVTTSRGGTFSPGHKRPGLGQTHSVDSGMPDVVEDPDGFTMVMPNLTSSQPRARSPLAYRSPMKALFDDARQKGKLSPEAERQISRSHEREASVEEAKKAPQSDEVQIYEDPFTDNTTQAGAAEERQVLGELPVNENVRLNSPAQSPGSSNSPAGSPRQVSDSRLPMSPHHNADVLRNKKLLSSGIERIRTKALDAHGFRRVQDLVKSKTDIWDGGKKYDELMNATLDYLQTFDQDPKLTQLPAQKIAGLKAQALGLVRAMLTIYRKEAVAWHAKSLVTVLICRKGIDSSSHILADMHRSADEIMQDAAPETCIDAILDFLPASGEDSATARSIVMALMILRQLITKAKDKSIDLGEERRRRLAQTTAGYVSDADSEVRKVDVDLASELYEAWGDAKGEFWQEFKGVDEGRLGLLTYYIAKKGSAV